LETTLSGIVYGLIFHLIILSLCACLPQWISNWQNQTKMMSGTLALALIWIKYLRTNKMSLCMELTLFLNWAKTLHEGSILVLCYLLWFPSSQIYTESLYLNFVFFALRALVFHSSTFLKTERLTLLLFQSNIYQ